MLTTPVLLVFFASSVLANIYITSPIATSVFTAGKQATISWQDDGQSPSLAQFGPAKVSIYAGNAQQQTSLQLIVPSVNVQTTNAIQFIPDATIGPNSNEYFIRFESLSLKDVKQPQYPALAFSSKFRLEGMTGQFSPAVQSQIAGQSTAPIAGPTPAPSSPAISTIVTPTTKAASGSTTTKAAASATHSSGALHVEAGWFSVLISAIVAVSMF